MQKPITLHSTAKINLTLDVLGRDDSGYHRIQTIYHEIPTLYDELTFEPHDKLELVCDHPEVPLDENNLIIKAAQLLTPSQGVKITLQKNIPLQSGLGGASSNAATTLVALNDLWDLQLSSQQLLAHATEIGMDVPFLLIGGTALGMHYGEHVMPIMPLEGYEIEVIETGIKVPTKEAYEALDLKKCGHRDNETSQLVHILNGNKQADPLSLLHNDFEENFFTQNPDLREKYPNAHLSGSGGCLFRIMKK
ncbi:4-(cytidine 5'-diphospho)-2-C-methyl-D-erythritol kinase [Candidatus Peregrinibacteria bacterium]|nr:4-(cytidine 5'-diphospho)-2-C-methyl-D-erythritol kinase [Candidatus Peregrinibacteria bacterium]MBT7483562.1 4-(cytidine 5'-diphospho)-2-C-methyl-D-erythritol kinase [Candidatus Peregrinibacteria bacterium]MBT7703346.1 4-(cytidine 5'-diphospho)-2-C-methyl-D-erythritol kinase [Candidatus Peregrinibacteria bacterium]